ncbi:probable G-protein coupled receptor 146 isoform X10 [Phalacrocorax carbo]|uniref:probable G-protein coupled receptor 146 isoform X10 n=1 Tax=Phalacrocorax carbo TaxID=9209 RepID=UPI0031199BC0
MTNAPTQSSAPTEHSVFRSFVGRRKWLNLRLTFSWAAPHGLTASGKLGYTTKKRFQSNIIMSSILCFIYKSLISK